MLRVSVSSTSCFQRCQQQYYYRYIRGFRRKERMVAPQLGILIHDYLDAYYSGLKNGVVALQAHWDGVRKLTTYRPVMRAMSESARMSGREDEAKEILEICPRAERICESYFAARGLHDANRYDVLEVELDVETVIAEGILSVGKIDLITRDRLSGLVHLWEHKSTGSEPPNMVRLIDLQTFVYDHQTEYSIDAVMWNYIRTHEPTVPPLVYRGTKREGLTRRSDLDTTWEVYLDAINAHGLKVSDYEDMRERLANRQQTVYFPRYEHVKVVEGILEHYVAVNQEVERVRGLWESGEAFPIRTLTTQCHWCDFYRLCLTALTGGDEDDIVDMFYTRREDRDAVGAAKAQ